MEALTSKVHPLALGNVERFLAQSRMVARKILRTHMQETEEHTMEEIIENMASKLYFHGHPINRQEAKDELRLEVNLELPPGLESAIWDLYKEYDEEFQNRVIFNPMGDLAALSGQAPGPPAPPVQMPFPGNPQMMMAVPAMTGIQKEYELLHVMIESTRLSSVLKTQRRYRLLTPMPGQQAVQEDVLKQAWTHSPVPAEALASPQQSSSAGGAQADAGVQPGKTEPPTRPAPGKT